MFAAIITPNSTGYRNFVVKLRASTYDKAKSETATLYKQLDAKASGIVEYHSKAEFVDKIYKQL